MSLASDFAGLPTRAHSTPPPRDFSRYRIVPARYGVVEDAAALQHAPLAAPAAIEEDAHEHEHDHETGLGLVSWSDALTGVYDETALREVLGAAAAGTFGELLRMKGIAQVRRGWRQFRRAGRRGDGAAAGDDVRARKLHPAPLGRVQAHQRGECANR